jgi:hypothetical protein
MKRRSTPCTPTALFVTLALVITGCGGSEPPAKDSPDRNTSLFGIVERMKTEGLEISEPVPMGEYQGQDSGIGRAIGIGNALSGVSITGGSKIKSDLPSESQRREIEGYTVVLRRYRSPKVAIMQRGRKQQEEDRLGDKGKVVFMQAEDKVLALFGTGTIPGSGIEGVLPDRPATAPNPADVERIREAFEASAP